MSVVVRTTVLAGHAQVMEKNVRSAATVDPMVGRLPSANTAGVG